MNLRSRWKHIAWARNARSAWQHIAWGGARLCERNPRIFNNKERQPVKRATAWSNNVLPPVLRAHIFNSNIPRVSLAKPRSTLGYMLSPASQAMLPASQAKNTFHK